MLLNDIGSIPTTTLRKINQHLESNYGFKLTENTDIKVLTKVMETIQDEITDLKLQGGDAKGSPEISKRLLVLEGVRTLKEFAMAQVQSPKLEPVIAALTAIVVKEFHRSGTSEADFETELKHAMSAYRSSEFRFPDDYIEQRVREAALAQLNSISEPNELTEISDELAGRYMHGAMRDTISNKQDRNTGMKHAMSRLSGTNRPLLGDPADTEEQIPMSRNPVTNQIEQDTAAAIRKGTAMRENTNLVKQLRTLLETEVSQAEVMMAAKGFAQELQEMVEKIGRLQNEDLPPVTDQMRETYGTDSASAFQTKIYGALQGVMDSLYTAKAQVDDAVTNMAMTGQVSAAVDMDKDMSGTADLGLDAELDLDNIGDDLAADSATDEFGGAEEEEPLGRAMKTESAVLKRKIAEMQHIVEKARRLKEARERVISE